MKCCNIALTFLAAAWTASAATPDYWPLEPGNQWIYRSTGGAGTQISTIEVLRNEVAGSRVYSVLRLSGAGDVWVRMDESGRFYAWDPRTRAESLWADFGAPTGSAYETALDPCNRTARVESRRADYRGPVGEFSEALHIAYPAANCADAGLTAEYYLPYVGLVRRDSLTIAGPRRMDLIYARLGGVTVISEPSVSFVLSLDKAIYTADLMPPVDPARAVPRMTARLALRNGQNEPIELVFPSGQSFDLVLRNDKGEAVYRWSDGRMFTQALRRENLAPGHERNEVAVVPLGSEAGPLPQGRYTAEAWLTLERGRVYASVAAFEIRHVH